MHVPETYQPGDDEGQDADIPPHEQHKNANANLSPPLAGDTDDHGATAAPVPGLGPIPPTQSNERKPSFSLANGVKRIFTSNGQTPTIVAPPTSHPPPPIVHKIRPAPAKTFAKPISGANTGTTTPSTGESPSASDSEWGPSPPSSRPPSRAVSVSASDGGHGKDLAASELTTRPLPPSRASSIKSSDGEGKFTLKELLGSGPKLGRKSSARSSGGSSKKSDSDRSTDSAGLLKKYGVCERVAIGRGATSVVRLAHKWDRSEEKLYAVKVCYQSDMICFPQPIYSLQEFRKRRKNETEKEYVKKLTAEFCISSTLHHVNIVETVDLVQDEQQRWCEVMEYCPGGDLYAAIKKGGMSPSEVECCFKQILCGVAYLHGQGVAHRDIKPENLFFDARGHLKVCRIDHSILDLVFSYHMA